MDLIGSHSSGELLVKDARGVLRKTRIYCSDKWIKRIWNAVDPRTDQEIRPLRPMNGGGKSFAEHLLV